MTGPGAERGRWPLRSGAGHGGPTNNVGPSEEGDHDDRAATGPRRADRDTAGPARDAHARYCADRSALYLVRPDGYVSFRSLPALARPLLDHLGTLFIRTGALRGG